MRRLWLSFLVVVLSMGAGGTALAQATREECIQWAWERYDTCQKECRLTANGCAMCTDTRNVEMYDCNRNYGPSPSGNTGNTGNGIPTNPGPIGGTSGTSGTTGTTAATAETKDTCPYANALTGAQISSTSWWVSGFEITREDVDKGLMWATGNLPGGRPPLDLSGLGMKQLDAVFNTWAARTSAAVNAEAAAARAASLTDRVLGASASGAAYAGQNALAHQAENTLLAMSPGERRGYEAGLMGTFGPGEPLNLLTRPQAMQFMETMAGDARDMAILDRMGVRFAGNVYENQMAMYKAREIAEQAGKCLK